MDLLCARLVLGLGDVVAKKKVKVPCLQREAINQRNGFVPAIGALKGIKGVTHDKDGWDSALPRWSGE